jgi:hypothetical protein
MPAGQGGGFLSQSSLFRAAQQQQQQQQQQLQQQGMRPSGDLHSSYGGGMGLLAQGYRPGHGYS